MDESPVSLNFVRYLSQCMKTKNFVSLSVAVVFAVLATTGLLIYFGQGTHVVEHTHAWFGILFVTAATFHIINNWSSIVGYTKNRRTGSVQKEFVLPALTAVVFAAGIGFGVPVFDKLANAGKELVRGKQPQKGPLTQPAVDSIARAVETAYADALSRADTAALAAVLSRKWSGLTVVETRLGGTEPVVKSAKPSAPNAIKTSVDHAEALDDNVIVVHGVLDGILDDTDGTPPTVYTHVLKKQDDRWQIVTGQTARKAP